MYVLFFITKHMNKVLCMFNKNVYCTLYLFLSLNFKTCVIKNKINKLVEKN